MVKILIVEDERIIAEDLKSTLEHEGYLITEIVGLPKQALESVEKQKPDIALVDIKLYGEMTGLDLAVKLKNEYGLAIVFCTAFNDQHTRNKAKKAEPLGYITKPIDDLKLVNVIKEAVNKLGLQ